MSSARSPLKVLADGEDPINTAAPSGQIYGQLDGGVYGDATKAEINNSCDLSTRLVSAGAALTLTVADHAEKIILLDGAAGSIVTLPPSAGSGATFVFLVKTVPSGGSHKIQVSSGAETLRGSLFMSKDDSAGAGAAFRSGNSDDTITLNGSTTGGALGYGEWIEVIDQSSNQFNVVGVVAGTGVEATPFSNAVS